jgi:two-component system, OmpR family, phosphate regulon sensor histidine kinase PhoR
MEDGRLGAILVLNDITRIKRLERVRRDFVANVSHELRTPITLIKGFIETLEDGAIGIRKRPPGSWASSGATPTGWHP